MKKLLMSFLLSSACCWLAVSAPVRSMLGADGAEKGDEWNPTAADYVHDGLEVLFDGIENVAYGISDPEATVWTDLVSGLKVGGCTFEEGTCLFSANKQTTGRCGAMTHNTIELLVSRVPGTTQNHSIEIAQYVTYNGSTTTKSFTAQRYPNNSLQYLNNVAGGIVTGTVPEDFHLLTASFEYANGEGLAKYYVDGKFIGDKWLEGDMVALDPGTVYFNFKVNNLFSRITKYNRVLSPDEIAYNYDIDRRRFGL